MNRNTLSYLTAAVMDASLFMMRLPFWRRWSPVHHCGTKGHPAARLFFILGAAALLSTACEGPVVARREPFKEAEVKWTRGKGSGAVTGQASITLKSGKVWQGSNAEIFLFPVSAYTTEFIKRQYDHGENLVSADDRLAQYLCKKTADESGNFSMRDLAPGNYYVGTRVRWNYWYWNDDGTKATVWHAQFIHARVTLRNGQASRVTEWIYGADKTL